MKRKINEKKTVMWFCLSDHGRWLHFFFFPICSAAVRFSSLLTNRDWLVLTDGYTNQEITLGFSLDLKVLYLYSLFSFSSDLSLESRIFCVPWCTIISSLNAKDLELTICRKTINQWGIAMHFPQEKHYYIQ